MSTAPVELRAQSASAPRRSTTATDDSHDSGSHASIFASGENQMEKKATEFLRLDGFTPTVEQPPAPFPADPPSLPPVCVAAWPSVLSST
jgi:hypothetical protein